jgi:hypothetical protein
MTENERQKAPIPNILIIDIKTRIPDHFSLRYKPSMTFPKEEGKYIYFDPLIMYNQNAVMTEEFFDKNKFETMMNRILSRFFTMQPKRISLDQGIIENNIWVTLNSLFGSGKLFYIHEKPYTIIDYKWDKKWTSETNYDVQTGGEDININVYPQIPGQKYVYKFKKKSAIKITIELELYPGKNPSLKAKSNILCERKMENIRRSYADLMGYEYRPAPTKYAKTRVLKRGGKKITKKGTRKYNKKRSLKEKK